MAGILPHQNWQVADGLALTLGQVAYLLTYRATENTVNGGFVGGGGGNSGEIKLPFCCAQRRVLSERRKDERSKKTRMTTSRHENTHFLEEYTLSVTRLGRGTAEIPKAHRGVDGPAGHSRQ